MATPPDPGSAKTVIRPRSGPAADSQVLRRVAEPVLALAAVLRDEPVRDVRRAVQAAADRLDRFDKAARQAGISDVKIAPARYGLQVVLDAHARANRDIALEQWAAGAQGLLFDGRDVTLAGLRDLRRKADEAGPGFADIGAFLGELVDRTEAASRLPERPQGGSRWWMAGLAVLVLASVAGAVWVDWRHHARITSEFQKQSSLLPLDPNRPLPILAAALDRMADLADRTEDAAKDAPVGLLNRIPALDAGASARKAYRDAVDRSLPPHVFAALDAALATEGDNARLYDTLRTHAILTGVSDWQPEWLAGWARDRDLLAPGLRAAAPHVAALSGPPDLPQVDAALLAQAQEFAAQTDEAERAYLELIRSPAVAAVPGWSPTERITAIGDVLVRRSGAPLSAPLPGIFTAGGWDHADREGAGLAVQSARQQAGKVLGDVPVRRNDTPDRVMDLLQRRTLSAWSDLLRDLRVRPFTDPDSAILISGTLSRQNSPLTRLLQQVWIETGGTDRSRSHPNQLAIATEFGPTIQFIEQGRMANISNLFAALNVALGALDADQEAGLDRLMSVQQRAASITALQQAPTVVVQIVEDVLAQTATAHDEVLQNPVARLWQAEVAGACTQITTGYPFTSGPDVGLPDFAEVFGPDGRIDRFFRLRLAQLIDTTATPWRWKPEAALGGLSQDSAAFFQKAAAIRSAYFQQDGTPGQSLTLTTLAERGTASVTLGGQNAPVRATGEPIALSWPGPAPVDGISFAIRQGDAQDRVSHPGPWGLLRMLDPLRLRERDDGKRFLIDLRFPQARFFLELEFDRASNPVSHRALLENLVCPPVL